MLTGRERTLGATVATLWKRRLRLNRWNCLAWSKSILGEIPSHCSTGMERIFLKPNKKELTARAGELYWKKYFSKKIPFQIKSESAQLGTGGLLDRQKRHSPVLVKYFAQKSSCCKLSICSKNFYQFKRIETFRTFWYWFPLGPQNLKSASTEDQTPPTPATAARIYITKNIYLL